MRTSRYISTLLLSLLLLPTQAKEEEKIPPAPLFCGAAVKVDLAGPFMKLLDCKFNQLEVGARLNFRDHYFPTAELGIGESDRESKQNNSTFHTRAPYFRLGMDYNINKKHNGNRLFLGLRYGLSRFNYDFRDPDFADPVWPGQTGLTLTGMKGTTQWAELCFGCETKLWSFVRVGWTFRYKMRLKQNVDERGEPYYTPGFGKTGGTVFGGTANLIFDVGRTTKKQKKN